MTDFDNRPLPIPTPGQLLSAQARAVADFRAKISREMGPASGRQRTAYCIVGFRHGWDMAIEYLRQFDRK